ncbi:5'-methylthioadenosine/S-adenosylhomocysteine nucleosidase family protein [Leptospira vanthielii]|uniref:5'-methylthioadenosine/S-adenosylhomocysteine nucleosidase family protein n=1 Tax=Leptospira vanthielii serovar Holland str. Waz Holland = ATCC 700522 TaxID=1218591 RepID=N1VWL9_9LEPT|nr:5'-methylthioadenosine/S-adenosylhomocysteine nucleosidase family protein [Leptospira vanthielii]EMY68374.1 5'-methylthioadenosine/S-adenosylhomocysteine nucleosidase family protein [Leptospira vanthielii serovar Holland str. Waz Holland = ATCC 700522]
MAKTTFVYDIIEKIDNAQSAIDNYKTEIQIDPSIKFPKDIVLSNIISADQDLDPSKINKLSKSYNASAADWESASIARICHKNNIQVIILRGISDIVTSNGSIVYKNQKLFEKNSNIIMKKTLEITKNLF